MDTEDHTLISDQALSLWEIYLKAWNQYIDSRSAVIVDGKETNSLISMIRYGLIKKHRGPVLDIIKLLNANDLKIIFKELMFECVGDIGYSQMFREIVLKLPREWLLENVGQYTDMLIEDPNGDQFITYPLLFTLYQQIDIKLAKELAENACKSDNEEIREIGENLLSRL